MDSQWSGSRRGSFDPTSPSFQPNGYVHNQLAQPAYQNTGFTLPVNQQFYWPEGGPVHMANTQFCKLTSLTLKT